MRRAVLIALFLLLGIGSAAEADHAPPRWLEPVTLSDSSGLVTDVAVDPAGDAVAVWVRFGVDSSADVVMAAYRKADAGSWSAPDSLGSGSAPEVAIDLQGNALAVWLQYVPEKYVVVAAYRPAVAGRWQAPARLTDLDSGSPQVGYDADGNATAAWVRSDRDGTSHVETAYRPAGSGWQRPVKVASTPSPYLFGAHLAVADDGSALLSWVEDRSAVRAALGRRGSWEAPVDLAARAGEGTEPASGVIAPGGRAVVVWWRLEGGNAKVQAAIHEAGAPAWLPPATVSFPDGQSFDPATGIDGRGNVTVLWRTSGGVEGSYLPAGEEKWERPVLVSPTGGGPDLGVNSAGDAVAIWSRAGAGNCHVLEGLHRPAGVRDWQRLMPVGEGVLLRALAIDGAGNAVAVWSQARVQGDFCQGAASIQASALDAAGPVFGKLTGSFRGHVGQPISFVARAYDVWSPLAGPPSWSFGDGSSGSGGNVRHAYSAPGTFLVSVTATDTLGHSTRADLRGTILPAERVENTTRPTIVGVARIGKTLTCVRGLWMGSPRIRYAYRWLRAGRPIPGATGTRYRLVQRDAGTLVACRVSATNPAGSAVAASRPVRIRR